MSLLRALAVVAVIAGPCAASTATAAVGSDAPAGRVPLDQRHRAHGSTAQEFQLSGSTAIGRDAQVTLDGQSDAVHALSLEYTCTGKDIVNDSDLRTATLASGRLPKPDARGRFHSTVKVHNSRFSEDGTYPLPDGKLVIDAKLKKSGTRRVIKGKFQIVGRQCTPPKVAFRVVSSGKNPVPQPATPTMSTPPGTA